MERVKGSVDLENCPVPEHLLGTLNQLPFDDAVQQVGLLPEHQRSKLAVFCYRRAHYRQLGLISAASCSERSLIEEAGQAGSIILAQSRSLQPVYHDSSDPKPRLSKRPVSIHQI